MTLIAIGLPHTPWIPERVASFERLVDQLESPRRGRVKVFCERESNRSWSQKLWRWACSTDATHLLQLQDDVVIASNFWAALDAMLASVPDQIIGLAAAHPLGPEMSRTGRHWYRTRWLIGPGYVWPLDPGLPNGLPEFLRWCDANPERVASTNEDSLVCVWAAERGIAIWHPVPTIIDHDLGVPSTYGNDTHPEAGLWRRPTYTWRDVERPEALEDPSYWRTTTPPLLPGPGTERCWYCGENQGEITSPKTGARLCRVCLGMSVLGALGLQARAG